MKVKILNYILVLSLLATTLAGTKINDNTYRPNSNIQTNISTSLITLECDGPDGVMLQ